MVETAKTQNSFLDNFWGPVDDDEMDQEVRNFYINFLSKTEKLKAEITGYDFREDKKQYTVYKIHVTADLIEFDVEKRYSQFEQFRKLLIDKYPELNLDKVPFPQKNYIKFFMDSVKKIVQRQMDLNKFLQVIVQNCKNYSIIELLDFLEVKDHLKNGEGNQASYLSMDKTFATNSQEVARLIQFLEILNKNPDDTSKTIKEMEAFYTSSRPRISFDIAKALLIGKPKSHGLIHFCGKMGNQSHLVCVIGLEFLASLMDHQKCQDADYFITAFGNLDPKIIAVLNLTDHIEGNIKSTCKSHALKVVDTYLSRNPKCPPNVILKKPSAVQEYELWRRQNKTNSLVAERFQVSGHLDEIREQNDFSLSPVSPTVDQFEDFSSNVEKIFAHDVNWTELYIDENIEIKYYKSKQLSIVLRTKHETDTCVREALRGIDYRLLCEETKKIKEIDIDVNLQLVKVRINNPNHRFVAFVNERKIEEEFGGKTTITETPCKNYSVMLNSSELLSKRISLTTVQYDVERKGNFRKIEHLVKNLDQGSMWLQNQLVEEDEGRWVIESCKKFLEDLERRKLS